MNVHLPSGKVVRVRAGDVRPNLADYCPKADEHSMPLAKRGYQRIVHPPCGLEVVWVRKARRR